MVLLIKLSPNPTLLVQALVLCKQGSVHSGMNRVGSGLFQRWDVVLLWFRIRALTLNPKP